MANDSFAFNGRLSYSAGYSAPGQFSRSGPALEFSPPGCMTLTGEENIWRVRGGDCRILYEIHEGRLVVLVIRTAHRREAYR